MPVRVGNNSPGLKHPAISTVVFARTAYRITGPGWRGNCLSLWFRVHLRAGTGRLNVAVRLFEISFVNANCLSPSVVVRSLSVCGERVAVDWKLSFPLLAFHRVHRILLRELAYYLWTWLSNKTLFILHNYPEFVALSLTEFTVPVPLQVTEKQLLWKLATVLLGRNSFSRIIVQPNVALAFRRPEHWGKPQDYAIPTEIHLIMLLTNQCQNACQYAFFCL